jgi:prevent-host-death family protein
MRSIGLRELRQHASRYLRLVQSGHSLQVTDRGRAIALLVPIPGGSLVDQLVAAGRA